MLLFRYWIVDRVGRRIRSAFSHYLAPSLVDRLVDSEAELHLGGERREVTSNVCRPLWLHRPFHQAPA